MVSTEKQGTLTYSSGEIHKRVLLSRAGAQHVQPEAFIGIDRVVITKDGTSTTVTGVDVVGVIAALYQKK